MRIKRTLFLIMIAMIILGLSLAIAQDDPFAGLGGGGDDGLAGPDGSSSIRAKRKASKEQFQGVVMKVVRSSKTFPKVTSVKVKIKKAPKSKAAPHKEIKKGKAYVFSVNYVMKDGKCDMTDKNNQSNMGAFYLKKGDKVVGEVMNKKDKTYNLLYIERK